MNNELNGYGTATATAMILTLLNMMFLFHNTEISFFSHTEACPTYYQIYNGQNTTQE